jgi:hypothetical protein
MNKWTNKFITIASTVTFIESDTGMWLYKETLIEKYFKEIEAGVTAHTYSIEDTKLFRFNSLLQCEGEECVKLPLYICNEEGTRVCSFTAVDV